jgi:hypothetical protein
MSGAQFAQSIAALDAEAHSWVRRPDDAERLGEEWVNPEQLGPWDGGAGVHDDP